MTSRRCFVIAVSPRPSANPECRVLEHQPVGPRRRPGGEQRALPFRGGKTHVVHLRGSRQSGSLAGLRLCIVMHVGNSGGSRGWQGLLGRPSDWGGPANPDQRASAKDRPTDTEDWAQMGPVVVSGTSLGRLAVSRSRGRVATACPLRSGPGPISADTPLKRRPPLTRPTQCLPRVCILLTRASILEVC
jgi:hypothetical protein